MDITGKLYQVCKILNQNTFIAPLAQSAIGIIDNPIGVWPREVIEIYELTFPKQVFLAI